jgi:hypothetical protein
MTETCCYTSIALNMTPQIPKRRLLKLWELRYPTWIPTIQLINLVQHGNGGNGGNVCTNIHLTGPGFKRPIEAKHRALKNASHLGPISGLTSQLRSKEGRIVEDDPFCHLSVLSQSYYWPQLRDDEELYVKTCLVCLQDTVA